jgi:AraC family transcriptional regulator
MTAEVYSYGELETPEFQTVEHTIVLHLSDPALVEITTNGEIDSRTRVSGDLSIVRAATVCQVRSREPHDVLVVAISEQLMAQSGFEVSGGPPFEPALRPYVRDAQVEHICRALKAEAESNYVSGPLYGESVGMALAAHLVRQYSANVGSTGQRGGLAPQALRRVVDYIESNLDTPLRLASLAEVAGLSQYRFAHNFRCAMRLPPNKYVQQKRIAHAKRMLRETKSSVQEIAYAVGCQSLSHFNCLFRRETGTIPSAYRASFR